MRMIRLRGLSPRVRGNLNRPSIPVDQIGSIPACAGEPIESDVWDYNPRVYPRVCGGTMDRAVLLAREEGLSPRVRGNQSAAEVEAVIFGSIPACAGEPMRWAAPTSPAGVYPRVCGGTGNEVAPQEAGHGLSPRVRGNLHQAAHPGLLQGSIPACAGEPTSPTCPPASARVYPRVCGGTASSGTQPADKRGLSPRVRGNPRASGRRRRRMGSIPACAGEPPRRRKRQITVRVYPRVCGGTASAFLRRRRSSGLSPRVRGNRAGHPVAGARRGSIPACAGEPGKRVTLFALIEVYPRVCGGTVQWPGAPSKSDGLSPRVRGNPTGRFFWTGASGSIPACAGEPTDTTSTARPVKVYPRVCGGTDSSAPMIDRTRGLSPRVRGNLC